MSGFVRNKGRPEMARCTIVAAMLVGIWGTVSIVWGMREYEHELTVCMDPNDPDYDPNTDFNTINEAID